MTPPDTWHPEEGQLQAYVDSRPGGLSAASIEAHLIACRTCRSVLRDAVPAPRLAAVLAEVEDRVDLLERPWLERLLGRCGVTEPDARALLAAPNVRLAWWGAVLAAVVLALLVSQRDRQPEGLFLLLAPLLPVVSTAAAYAPGLDRARAIVAATPYPTSRLLLARSLAVGGTALIGSVVAALALPQHDLIGLAWMLPSLALTLLVLALSPWAGTGPAAASVAGGWVAVVATLGRRGVEPLSTIGGVGQLVSAGLAAVALVVLTNQWKHLDQGGQA